MVFLKTITWETALDLTGILLCCFIIIYLVFNKFKHHRLLMGSRLSDRVKTFGEDISHQMVKQQAERILNLVFCTLASELMILKKMTAAEGVAPYQFRASAAGIRPRLRSEPHDDLLGPSPVGFEPDPYAEVTQLSQDGLSPQQIAEKVMLPLGEIELLLKLYRVR